MGDLKTRKPPSFVYKKPAARAIGRAALKHRPSEAGTCSSARHCVLVIGDLNVAPCLELDHCLGHRANHKAPGCSPTERDALHHLCVTHGLVDGYRHLYACPKRSGFTRCDPPVGATCWNNRGKAYWKRYDLVLLDRHLLGKLADVRHLTRYDNSGSDHRPIVVDLSV